MSTTVVRRQAWVDQARLVAGQELVLAATRGLTLAADLPTLVTLVQGTARRLVGADGSTFAIRAGDEVHYLDENQPAATGSLWKGQSFPLGDRLSGWTMQHGRPAVVQDAAADPRLADVDQQIVVPSAVVVPVRSAQPMAALGAYWVQRHEPDATEVLLLRTLADSVAVALEGLHGRRQLQARASARSAEIAALTYAVSHDLRAPIRHLEGFARILLQDVADLGPETRHGAQRIQDAAAHLREMVNGMLALSRIGQTEIHSQSVDLAQLGREVAQSLANAPTPADRPARAGVVQFIAPESLPTCGDPRLLLTVLQSLLDNAWKFSSLVADPRVELGIAPDGPDGPGPVYFVRDNGAGFEPGSAEKLFVAFQRLHSREEFPGIGIGLASVKQIIDKHGGTVRATGTPDGGATVFFTLPEQTPPTARARIPAPRSPT